MKNEAKAFNKYLTDEYLDKLSWKRLLGLTHPIYRPFHRETILRLLGK